WAYVKAAMIRADLATRADIDRLASRVGMTPYSVQISAAGFKRAADRASASVLRDTMSLKKVHMPVGQAPRGAVITWAPGCRGAPTPRAPASLARWTNSPVGTPHSNLRGAKRVV